MKCAWQFYRKSTLPRSLFYNHCSQIKSNQMLVFDERRKREYPGKILSEQNREPTISLLHMWRQMRKSNPGHIGGRQLLSQYVVVVFLMKYCYRLFFFFNCWGLLFVTCSIAGRTWWALGFAILRLAVFKKLTLPMVSQTRQYHFCHVWVVRLEVL